MSDEQSPRERLRFSFVGHLDDAELLSVLLPRSGERWRDAVARAQAFLDRQPRGLASLHDFLSRPTQAVPGLKAREVATLAAAVELGLRVAEAQLESEKPVLDTPHRISSYVLRLRPAEGETGILVLDALSRARQAHRVLTHRDAAALAAAAFLDRAEGLVLWRYRDAPAEVRSEDRHLARFLQEGCRWLRLPLAAVVVGPGGDVVSLLDLEEPVH